MNRFPVRASWVAAAVLTYITLTLHLHVNGVRPDGNNNKQYTQYFLRYKGLFNLQPCKECGSEPPDEQQSESKSGIRIS